MCMKMESSSYDLCLQLQMAFPAALETSKHQSYSSQSTIIHILLKEIKDLFEKGLLNGGNKIIQEVITSASLNYKYFPMYEYGSMAVLHKKKQEELPGLFLSFPCQWKVGVKPSWDLSKIFPVNSSQYESFYVGKIQDESQLQTVAKRIQHYLEFVIYKMQSDEQVKKKKNHHTPSWLLQAFLKVLELIQKNIDLTSKDLQINFLSKGGTLDVGQHTGITQPEVIYGVNWSFLNLLIGNTQLLEAIELIYKMSLLNKCVLTINDDKKNQSQIKGAMLKQCILQMRGNLQRITFSKNQYVNIEKTSKYLTELSKLLFQIQSPQIQQYKSIAKFVECCYWPEFNVASTMWSYQNLNSVTLQLTPTPKIQFTKTQIFHYLYKKIPSKLDSVQEWLQMVEDSVFTLGINELGQKQQPFSMITHKPSEFRSSDMTLCLFKYCEYMEKIGKYKSESVLTAQIYSHIELMKCLFSCIAFEVYKREKKGTIYDVCSFRIPNNVPKLFENFNSISYKARRVVKAITEYYLEQKDKIGLFDWEKGYQNYRLYSQQVSSQSSKLKEKVDCKQVQLRLSQQQLRKKIENSHNKSKNYREQIYKIRRTSCNCYHDYSHYKSFNKVQCSRCISLKSLQNQYHKHEKQRENYLTPKMSEERIQRQNHQFFEDLQPQMIDLLEILVYSQYTPPQKQKSMNENFQQHILFNKRKLKFIVNLPKPNTFTLSQENPSNADNLTLYMKNNVIMKWQNSMGVQKDYDLLTKHNQISSSNWKKKCYDNFLNDPSNPAGDIREHEIYANFNHKSHILDSQQYIGLGSIRVGLISQIPILLDKILDRKLTINSVHSADMYPMHIVWKSVAHLQSEADFYFYDKRLPDGIQGQIKNQINKFFSSFIAQWSTHDFLTLPILGCIFSLLCKMVKYKQVNFLRPIYYSESPSNFSQPGCPKMFDEILSKIEARYEIIEEDNKRVGSANEKVYNENCIDQSFLCFGGLCCFSESIISPEDKICIQFLKLVVIMRFKKIFIQFQNDYLKAIHKFKSFQFLALQNNIHTALQHLITNPEGLTDIVKVIDEGISQNTQWKWMKEIGHFTFHGTSKEKSYEIDIYSGQLLINGSAASQVPPKIRQSSKYKIIFGTKNFQVYISKSKESYITRRDFSQLFYDNVTTKDKVFFEFGFSKTKQKPCISMIIQIEDEGQRWERWKLINNQDLLTEINIPRLYSENHLAWFCQQKNCIIFRRKSLEEMCEIGLVAFYKDKFIRKAIKISKQHLRSPLNELCSIDSNIFDTIVLLSDKEKYSQTFEVLTKFEEKKYIIELKTCTEKNIFWLHRFGISFYSEETALIPEPFKNYKLPQKPFSHHYVPWNVTDYPFLIIQKNILNEQSLLMHEYKVIVPYHPFDKSQKNGQNSLTKLKYYSYDIHNDLKRLYGPNRQSQLLLVGILELVYKGKKAQFINMTTQQYALLVLKSCFNNSPLNDVEFRILRRIQEVGMEHKNWSLILMAHALFRVTRQLFRLEKDNKEKAKSDQKYEKLLGDPKYIDSIGRCISAYNLSMKDGRISKRATIPDFVCEILDIKFESFSNYRRRAEIKEWQSNFPLHLEIPSKQNLSEFKECLAKASKIKKKPIQNANNNNSFKGRQIPLDLSACSKTPFGMQLKDQIEASYQACLLDQYHNSQINIQNNLNPSTLVETQQTLIKAKKKLTHLLFKCNQKNRFHIDVITGFKAEISRFDFADILLEKNALEQLYPQNSKQDNSFLRDAMKIWFKLVVQIKSFQRILFYLKSPSLDKIALLREIQSPREEIQKKMYWLCLQVQMNIQIWASQYETFQHLFSSQSDSQIKNGCVLQLNMGEGKTQVIVPMIILELIYGNLVLGKTPRINLLTPIFQESKNNYFKFLSMNCFSLPIIEFPFNREIDITRKQTLNGVLRLFGYFCQKMVLLVDQSSLHSIILKLRETSYKLNGTFIKDKQKSIFKRLSCVDIHDEVDAMMVPTKSFIYSIGKPEGLDRLIYRAKISQILIQATMKNYLNLSKYITFDENSKLVEDRIDRGEYPKGLRFLSTVIEQNTPEFSQANVSQEIKNIILGFILKAKDKYEELKFISTLSSDLVCRLREYILDDSLSIDPILQKTLTQKALSIVYCLRGYFAHGIYTHCMILRPQIKYGVPDKERINRTGKRISVPYEAANVPSKRNDYAQPDVAIYLTYLSYYNSGLSFEDLREGFVKLEKITKGNDEAKAQIYKTWYSTLSLAQQKQLKIENAGEIKIDSEYQMGKLFEAYRFNCKFIGFWLINCVLPNDMVQYLQTLTSSSWDHSDVKESIGFSGTKDMHLLFPHNLKFEHSSNNRIKGTDGNMIQLVFKNTLDKIEVNDGELPLWKRFIETILQQSKSQSNIGCIIDVGALLAGSQLQSQIVPWLGNQQENNISKNFKGISYCYQNKWYFYDIRTCEIYPRGIVADHQTFIIFDEYRTRGADFKMDKDVVGIVSLGPFTTKVSLMQGIGRLRKLGRNQKIIFVMNKQVKQKIKQMSGYKDVDDLQNKIDAVLRWCCLNSTKENEKYLLENSKLAKVYFQNKKTSETAIPFTNKIDTTLFNLYAAPTQYQSIHQLTLNLFRETQMQVADSIINCTQKFGKKIMVKSENFDEVKEKESQIQASKEKQKQRQSNALDPIKQREYFISKSIDIPGINFHSNLKYSLNFKECTSYFDKKPIKDGDKSNELGLCHFVYLQPEEFCMITIREANTFLLNDKVEFYSPQQTKSYKKFIARLSDLTIQSKYLVDNNLCNAYVQCKFFNGQRKFNDDQLQILKGLLLSSKPDEQKLTYFIKKRKLENFYPNSSLEKLFKEAELIGSL